MKILITGAGGFIGSRLAAYLLQQGHEVYGTFFKKKTTPPGLRSFLVDLTRLEKVSELIKKSRPEIIFHLAGQTLIMPSWQNPEKTILTNLLSTLYLIQEISRQKIKAKLIIFGSSSEYLSAKQQKIKESNLLYPSSPYALSKIMQDMLGRLYVQTSGLEIIIIRPFSIIGPGKTGDVSSDLACELTKLEKAQNKELSVGDTNIVRDFLDIEDALSGIWTLALKGKSGEAYNLCSGRATRISQLITIYQSLVPFKFKIKTNPDLKRPLEEKYRVGDNRKLTNLGWLPKIKLKTSLSKILNYWQSVKR